MINLHSKSFILKSKTPLIHNSWGIYFLIYKDEIVYIGKSNRCRYRVRTHIKQCKMRFDSYYIIPIDSDIRFIEKDYIKKFKPKYNKQLNPNYISPLKKVS